MKQKVLFVINTMGHAGAEMAMLELLQYFKPEEYDISLYVLLGQGELVRQLPDHVKLLNKRYYDTSVLEKKGYRTMFLTVLRAAISRGTFFRRLPYLIRNLKDMIKKKKIWPDKLLWRILSDGAAYPKESYDLAVAYLEGGSAYYVADHVMAKQKAAFIHIDYKKAGYSRQLDLDCYLEYDRIFTISKEVRQEFLKVYPECEYQIKVFNNMINKVKIKKRAKESGGFTDSFKGIRILTVGRLVFQKAYNFSINAMKLLKDEGYPVRWYVLGEGSQRYALEKQIKELGLTEDFILLGAVSNPYPYYVQADLYVHATRYEGKSIAIQEAQTLGCAIIASDCSGNREQIEHDVDGILCDLSAQEIKESIVTLIEDSAKRNRLKKAAEKKELSQEGDIRLLLEMMNS